MSAKSKSSIPGTPNAKSSPATPRIIRGVAKPSGDSVSSLQNGRTSVDRSPGSVTSKPKVERLSPKPSTPTDRKTTRLLRPSSELQAELIQAQEDLKKANEKLVLVEKEKARALDEVKESRRLCDEANEKLEAFLAQKRAEENTEIEKFRALEMEQVGIEATNGKEDELVRELEAVRSQHAVDVAALLSTTQELQNVKQELTMTFAAKNQALSHADDATKIAEIHAKKVELLSAEVILLKAALESRVESDKLVSDLKLEIDSLKQELEKAKKIEEKMAGNEAALEKLNVDLEASKMAECYAHSLVKELQQRVEDLAIEAEQGRESEKSASESLGTVMRKLEESKDLLHDAKSEIATLKEKLSLLETSSEKQKGHLDESEHRLEQAKGEASEMVKKVEFLESELEATRRERSEALNNEKLAAASLQSLLEEKNKLLYELETLKDEEEKSKKELESVASALHEVSSEARDAKEKLISSQVEHENYERQIEGLKLVLQSTNDKYESMINDANKQIVALTDSVEQSKHDYDNLKAELEQKELALESSVKKSEGESSRMEDEISRLIHSVEQSKHDYDNLKAELEQKELDLVNSVKKSEEENHHMESENSRLIKSLEQSKHDYDNLKAELEQKELYLVNSVKKSEEENHRMESENSRLIKSLEQSKHDYDNLKAELEQKELDMLNSVKRSEEENSHLENEINRLLNLLKLAEEESSATRDERDCSNKSLKEADLEAIYLKQVLGEAKEESTRLKEGLTEMENQLHKILAENEDLRRREAASQEKVGELSKSLEEALAKREEEDGDLTDCEKDYDMLPKVVEFSEQNGKGDVRPTAELQSQRKELPLKEKPTEVNSSADRSPEIENSNEKQKDGDKNTESTEVDLKMWESCKIDVKDFSPEREAEHESFEDELDSRGDGGDLYDHANGVSSTENLGSNDSPPLKSSSQKKKKPLLQKFGSLLKKKSSSNQK